MNFRGLSCKTLRFRQKLTRIIKKVKKEWEKEEWRRYECGNYTDIDEENHCPHCGMDDEPNKLVRVRKWKLRRLAKEGKVWTKYPRYWEGRLAQ